jgi:hypothetical protein
MGIIGNLDNYLKYQSANAMESAAKNPGGEASAGVGMGIGFAMANQMGKMVTSPQAPPSPSLEDGCRYFVGKNGKQAGPFDQAAIISYIKKGVITGKTLMWKQGMEGWNAAELFTEFETTFKATPPPMPK